MRLIFHGGAQQVGRSCIELQTGGDRYLLDCGIKFRSDGFDYPEKVFEVKDIDGVLISHAHLDHTGALPFFEHHNLICPIFMTPVTKPIVQILLKDSYKIARIRELHPAYTKPDLKKVKKQIRSVAFDKRNHFRKIYFTYLNAGHIPGSASILIETEGKRILYTGDFNTRKNNLVKPADSRDVGDVDVLITETTYGARELPEREPLEQEFLDQIAATVAQGGRVLIPVFALGRSQEVLIMLSKRKWKVPIYFDGMCKQITRKILTSPTSYVINKNRLNRMYFEEVKYISSDKMREEIVGKPGIFVCTSGMMQGGPAIEYLKRMWHDPRSAVMLTGYQIRHTNGWLLAESREIYINGWKTKVRCFVKRYDFSGHLDRNDLIQYILSVNPKKLILQHGNEEAVAAMKEWAERNLSCEVHAPAVGDIIDV